MTATLTPPTLRPPASSPPSLSPPLSKTPSAGDAPPRRGRMSRMVRGDSADPSWTRPALLVLLAATGLLYTWDLSASGYANSFYAAAVQAGSHSWKAWFFGSLDSSNFITVDKPPASLWIMGLSARLFGFNSWSLLLPQALEGVAAVGLLYATVKRWSGPKAGLFAGAAMALTPAAVLMFRFDNPDALLTLCLVGAAYGVTRALEKARMSWLMLAGSLMGLAFLTKMLQGFLVLPALGLVYLIAAPTSVRKRIGHLLAGLGAMIVAGGWWVAAVAFWPASSRPYIGGSTDNNVLNLVFGYNGFGRLLGGSGNGGGGGGGGNSGFGGATGLSRLFSSEMGNEISWLLPAALVALVAGLWVTRRAPRTDRTRAALIIWGGWLLVTGLIFSYMQGTIHPYYTVVLAPPIAALIAVSATALWKVRTSLTGRVGLASIVLAAGGWSAILLDRNGEYPIAKVLIVLLTMAAVAGLFIPRPRLGRAAIVTAIAAGLIGTASYGVATASVAHTGSIPSVGSSASAGMGGGGAPSGTGSSGTGSSGTRPSGSAPSGSFGGGSSSSGSSSSGSTGGSTTSGTAGGSVGGGTSSNTALATALKSTTSTWAAATVGDQSAAELELASGKAVMAIGGWSGSDATPTLAQFEKYVQSGQIRYFIVGNGGGGAGGGGTSSAITAWVKAHYTATTIGGQTVYDLSKATS